MLDSTNLYETADCFDIGRACDGILGEKPVPMYDTIQGDPDLFHRPQTFADCEE